MKDSSQKMQHFRRLVPKLSTFAISGSKHGGQLLNQLSIYSKDITPRPRYSKGWRIFKMTAAALTSNILSRIRTQGI